MTATLALIALIAVLSLIPPSWFPLREADGRDKVHHFLAYVALAFPVSLARPHRWPLWLLGFAAFGGLIEILQPLIERDGEVLDWLADTGGLGVGAAAGLCLGWFLRQRR